MDKALVEKLTLGGKVPLPANVTLAKLAAADQIVEGIGKGDALAIAEFKRHMGARYGETLTTGDDFIYALNHLVALEVTSDWEARERTWDQVTEVQVVSTFDAPRVYSIDAEVTGLARPVEEPGRPDGIAPIVPEASPYPEFKFSGELSQGGAIHKSGGAFGLTFERIVSDPGEIIPVLPRLITEFLLEREEWDVYNGLLTFIDKPALHLQAGTTLDGVAVPADAPLSRASLDLAIQQLDLRQIGGRAISVGSYTLVVPVGSGRTANWFLNTLELQSIGQTDGLTNRQYAVNGFNPLSKITNVVESRYFTGTQWALIPTPGTIAGGKRFFNLGRLRGHEGPEIRLENVTGNYLGGGAVSPFEGSFDTDSARFRGRIISGALLWNDEYGLLSDGDGA